MDELKSGYWSGSLRQRVSRRTVLRGAGMTGAGLAAAALIGCGSDEDDPEPTAAATSAGTGTAAATATEAVAMGKPGGRLALSQAGDPPSFDLHRESTTYTNYVTSMAYNQIVRFDPMIGAESPDTIIGDLASEWEISPDGQTYTFHLVQNAKFHDGTPFTAADAAASYQRQKDKPEDLPAPPRGDQLGAIGSMETPDDHTLVMNMSRPVSALSMLPILGQSWMAIYPAATIAAGFDRKALANGTGAFRMSSYEQGVKVTLDKNPDYWQENLPYLDGVDVFVVPDASTALANFQGGQIHVYAPNRRDLESLQNALGDKIVTEEGPSLGFNVINFGGIEPWTDVRVRQAIAMAMDKNVAIEVQNQGDGLLGGYMPAGGFWSLSDSELAAIPGYEPFTDSTVAEARKLLDAAGVPASMDARILTRQGSSFEPFSLYIQDQLAKVGIAGSLDIQETASAYDILAKRDFDLAPWNHGIALDDPDAIYSEFYITGGARNYSQVSTPEIDEAYLTQSQEQDPEARRALVKELQKISMPAYGKVLTNWSSGREAHWATVKDYTRHQNSYNARQWRQVWLDV